jgi:hypothetical protein
MRTMTWRNLLAVFSALVLLAGACGNGDDVATVDDPPTVDDDTTTDDRDDVRAAPGDFCRQVEQAEDTFDAFEDDDFDDPEIFEEALQTLRAMDVPGEIRDDWNQLIEGLEALRDFDPFDEEAMAELEERFEGFEEANSRIVEYVRDVCGIDLDDDDFDDFDDDFDDFDDDFDDEDF